MPKVITRNAIIRCPHGGIGQSMPSQTAVLVGGAPVLVDGDTGVIQNCSNVPPAGVPCAGYVLRSMHLNAVTVDGRSALIDTDFEKSLTGYPLVMTEFHQVEDRSLRVTIPPGGTLTTPPELQDTDKPTVVAVPPALGFSKVGFANTGAPTFLSTTFTLTSTFPNRWMLTLVVPPGSSDVTSSSSPQVTVQPSGGFWNASPLTVTVTLAGAYITTLPVFPAKVSLVMVAINRRGRSASAETVLEVSP
ncbi:MAG: hypothetical protein ACTHLX_10700 [Candidatus Binatia bacterium]